MAFTPSRPTHTGSARQQARRGADRARKTDDLSPPTHQRHPGAAVALEASLLPTRPRPRVRRARQPLGLGAGRLALAVRQWPGDRGLEVLVRELPGQARWRPVGEVLTAAQARIWARSAFEPARGD